METYSYPFTVERLLFFLSMFLVLLIGSLSSLQPLCHEDERSALLQFKDSFVINKSASPYPSAYIRLHHGLRKESMVIAAYGMGSTVMRKRVILSNLISVAVVSMVLSTLTVAFFTFFNFKVLILLIMTLMTLKSHRQLAIFRG